MRPWTGAIFAPAADIRPRAADPVSKGWPARLACWAGPHGEIRELSLAPDPSAPLVLLIQDVHENEPAQRHVSQFIASLDSSWERGPLLIGVEGAVGGFQLAPYRDFSDRRAVRDVADAFLRENFIGGAEHAAWTADRDLALWGVEDMTPYLAHIRAFKEALALQPRLRAILIDREGRLDALKSRLYPPPLLELDRARSAYRAGTLALDAYLRRLTIVVRPAPGRFPQLDRLRAAFALEAGLDPAAAERERRDLAGRLAAALPSRRLEALASAGPAGFYPAMKELCAAAKIDLKDFPRLTAYADHAAAADRIRTADVLEELTVLEELAFAALIASKEQRGLYRLAEDHRLLRALTELAMTPRDWAAYDPDRIRRLPEEWTALGAGPAPAEEMLRPFESFCRLALARDQIMADNLWRAMQGRTLAVLVAGGFHSAGLAARLRARGASCAVVTPKIGDVQPGAGYQVLAAGPPPLEKMFLPETINLKSPLRSGARRSVPGYGSQSLRRLAAVLLLSLGTQNAPAADMQSLAALAGVEEVRKATPTLKDGVRETDVELLSLQERKAYQVAEALSPKAEKALASRPAWRPIAVGDRRLFLRPKAASWILSPRAAAFAVAALALAMWPLLPAGWTDAGGALVASIFFLPMPGELSGPAGTLVTRNGLVGRIIGARSSLGKNGELHEVQVLWWDDQTEAEWVEESELREGGSTPLLGPEFRRRAWALTKGHHKTLRGGRRVRVKGVEAVAKKLGVDRAPLKRILRLGEARVSALNLRRLWAHLLRAEANAANPSPEARALQRTPGLVLSLEEAGLAREQIAAVAGLSAQELEEIHQRAEDAPAAVTVIGRRITKASVALKAELARVREAAECLALVDAATARGWEAPVETLRSLKDGTSRLEDIRELRGRAALFMNAPDPGGADAAADDALRAIAQDQIQARVWLQSELAKALDVERHALFQFLGGSRKLSESERTRPVLWRSLRDRPRPDLIPLDRLRRSFPELRLEQLASTRENALATLTVFLEKHAAGEPVSRDEVEAARTAAAAMEDGAFSRAEIRLVKIIMKSRRLWASIPDKRNFTREDLARAIHGHPRGMPLGMLGAWGRTADGLARLGLPRPWAEGAVAVLSGIVESHALQWILGGLPHAAGLSGWAFLASPWAAGVAAVLLLFPLLHGRTFHFWEKDDQGAWSLQARSLQGRSLYTAWAQLLFLVAAPHLLPLLLGADAGGHAVPLLHGLFNLLLAPLLRVPLGMISVVRDGKNDPLRLAPFTVEGKQPSRGYRRRMRESALENKEIILRFEDAVRKVRRAEGKQDPFNLEPAQLTVALVLQAGHLAGLPMGRGKTIALGLAAALYAAAGRQVHLMSANIFLAYEGFEEIAPVLAELGISAGFIDPNGEGHAIWTPGGARAATREEALAQTVVYGAYNDFIWEDFNGPLRMDVALVDEFTAAWMDPVPAEPVFSLPKARGNGVRKAMFLAARDLILRNGGRLPSLNTLMAALDPRMDSPANRLLAGRVLTAYGRVLKSGLKNGNHFTFSGPSIVNVHETSRRPTLLLRHDLDFQTALELLNGLPYRDIPPGGTLGSTLASTHLERYKTFAGTAGDLNALDKTLRPKDKKIIKIKPHEKSNRVDFPTLSFETALARDRAYLARAPKDLEEGRPVMDMSVFIEEAEYLDLLGRLLRTLIGTKTRLSEQDRLDLAAAAVKSAPAGTEPADWARDYAEMLENLARAEKHQYRLRSIHDHKRIEPRVETGLSNGLLELREEAERFERLGREEWDGPLQTLGWISVTDWAQLGLNVRVHGLVKKNGGLALHLIGMDNPQARARAARRDDPGRCQAYRSLQDKIFQEFSYDRTLREILADKTRSPEERVRTGDRRVAALKRQRYRRARVLEPMITQCVKSLLGQAPVPVFPEMEPAPLDAGVLAELAELAPPPAYMGPAVANWFTRVARAADGADPLALCQAAYEAAAAKLRATARPPMWSTAKPAVAPARRSLSLLTQGTLERLIQNGNLHIQSLANAAGLSTQRFLKALKQDKTLTSLYLSRSHEWIAQQPGWVSYRAFFGETLGASSAYFPELAQDLQGHNQAVLKNSIEAGGWELRAVLGPASNIPVELGRAYNILEERQNRQLIVQLCRNAFQNEMMRKGVLNRKALAARLRVDKSRVNGWLDLYRPFDDPEFTAGTPASPAAKIVPGLILLAAWAASWMSGEPGPAMTMVPILFWGWPGASDDRDRAYATDAQRLALRRTDALRRLARPGKNLVRALRSILFRDPAFELFHLPAADEKEDRRRALFDALARAVRRRAPAGDAAGGLALLSPAAADPARVLAGAKAALLERGLDPAALDPLLAPGAAVLFEADAAGADGRLRPDQVLRLIPAAGPAARLGIHTLHRDRWDLRNAPAALAWLLEITPGGLINLIQGALHGARRILTAA